MTKTSPATPTVTEYRAEVPSQDRKAYLPSYHSPSGEITDSIIDLFNDYFIKLLKMQTRWGQRKVAEMGY